jgi:predicted PurR-regulated permease PerM
MKIFKIYTHESGTTKAIKQGWSWTAFLFTFYWALFKKLWGIVIIAVLVFLALSLSVSVMEDDLMRAPEESIYALSMIFGFVSLFVVIGIPVWFGVSGNTWVEEKLTRKGYEKRGIIEAISPKDAISRFNEQQQKGEQV